MAFGRPWRFMAFLMNFNAAALSLFFVTNDSSTTPSWSTARHSYFCLPLSRQKPRPDANASG
jgi:hypothetical protein